MRKYGAYLAALAAVTLIGPTAIAVAHAGKKQTKQGKQSFIVLGRHHQRVALYVQHSRGKAAHSAACPAGNFDPAYCSPPVQEDLFGAYAWNDGGVTFGSNSNYTCRALGWSSNPCGVYTRGPNRLLVAFVGGDGKTGDVQSLTVSCKTASGGTCPVTFHKVNAEGAVGGDSEVWYADATNTISKSSPIFVTASASKADCGSGRAACDVSLQVVTFANAITSGASGAQATGIGASSICSSTRGAPSCSLTTTEPDSFVWAALNNPSASTIPTWPSNQFAVGVSDPSSRKTFYSQFLGTCTANANGSHPCTTMPLPNSGLYQNPYKLSPTASPFAGTKVTINDTAPTTNAFNEVVVEIL